MTTLQIAAAEGLLFSAVPCLADTDALLEKTTKIKITESGSSDGIYTDGNSAASWLVRTNVIEGRDSDHRTRIKVTVSKADAVRSIPEVSIFSVNAEEFPQKYSGEEEASWIADKILKQFSKITSSCPLTLLVTGRGHLVDSGFDCEAFSQESEKQKPSFEHNSLLSYKKIEGNPGNNFLVYDPKVNSGGKWYPVTSDNMDGASATAVCSMFGHGEYQRDYNVNWDTGVLPNRSAKTAWISQITKADFHVTLRASGSFDVSRRVETYGGYVHAIGCMRRR